MFIYYCVLAVSFFIAAYVIRIKRDIFYSLAKHAVGMVNELLSDADEDERIEFIQKKTNALSLSLVKMLLLIIAAALIGAIPLIIYSFATATPFELLDFTSFGSIIAISVGASIVFFIPFSKSTSSDYSELSQLLHHMALDNYHLSRKLFKWENKQARKKGLQSRNDFLIITGLARAGTTSLMNDLSRVEEFVSLNYSNMPFLMIPNTWRKIYNPKSNQLKERSHQDGIMIGYDSNEALEEYFFKMVAKDSYIQEDHLSEYDLSESDYNEYLDYQSNIKQQNEKIYLAKNNNFILRYDSIRAFNQEFKMVILFRDPLPHAASLKEKHEYYQDLQKQDPFVLNYMNWLGHHEFGSEQKVFHFKDISTDWKTDKSSLDYWLQIWINYYQRALQIEHKNTLFIDYESYCSSPNQVIDRILDKFSIKRGELNYNSFNNRREANYEVSPELAAKAKEIYSKLKAK